MRLAHFEYNEFKTNLCRVCAAGTQCVEVIPEVIKANMTSACVGDQV